MPPEWQPVLLSIKTKGRTCGELWKQHKELEHKAMKTLWPKEKFVAWPTNSLPSHVRRVRNSRHIASMLTPIVAYLETAMQIRKVMVREYPFANLEAQRSHEHFIGILNEMIKALARDDGNLRAGNLPPVPPVASEGGRSVETDVQPPRSTTSAAEGGPSKDAQAPVETPSPPQSQIPPRLTSSTLDEAEHAEFLNVLLSLLAQVHSLWADWTGDGNAEQLAFASIGSSCFCRDINAVLAEASLSRPHWFNSKAFNKKPLPDVFQRADRAIDDMIRGRDTEDAKFVAELKSHGDHILNGEKGSGSYGTEQLAIAIKDYQDRKDKYRLMQAIVFAAVHLGLRSAWPPERIDRVRRTLHSARNHNAHCLLRIAKLSDVLGNKALMPPSDAVREAVDGWTLGQAAVDILGSAQIIGRHSVLSREVVVFLHAYAAATIGGFATIDVVETICNHLGSIAFLEGRPLTPGDFERSRDRWLISWFTHDLKIQTRVLPLRMKHHHLLNVLIEHDFSINRDVGAMIDGYDPSLQYTELIVRLLAQLRRDMQVYSLALDITLVVKEVVKAIASERKVSPDEFLRDMYKEMDTTDIPQFMQRFATALEQVGTAASAAPP